MGLLASGSAHGNATPATPVHTSTTGYLKLTVKRVKVGGQGQNKGKNHFLF